MPLPEIPAFEGPPGLSQTESKAGALLEFESALAGLFSLVGPEAQAELVEMKARVRELILEGEDENDAAPSPLGLSEDY